MYAFPKSSLTTGMAGEPGEEAPFAKFRIIMTTGTLWPVVLVLFIILLRIEKIKENDEDW